MTVNDISAKIKAKLICGSMDKEWNGVYVGDLLSRAMSHVEADNLWITIMPNTNTVAVASLTEAAAVILAEDVELPDEAIEAANTNGITVLTSPLSAYELCVSLNDLASGSAV
ncbi:MAG: hypothetical protein IJY93_07745 [Clostridia bacterium]|nr:hypothetical protein [Clostridia bacterium]